MKLDVRIPCRMSNIVVNLLITENIVTANNGNWSCEFHVTISSGTDKTNDLDQRLEDTT